MYLNIRTIVLCCLALCLQSPLFAQPDYASMVDPFIGTGGHGHTYPGATVPYGMVQLSPDTRIDGSWDGCGGYHYSDFILYGFSHTHLSGTGCSDYGDILLLPFTGKFNQDKKYSSNFSHNREKSAPGYYQVHLEDDNIDVELSATESSNKLIFADGGQQGATHGGLEITSPAGSIDFSSQLLAD